MATQDWLSFVVVIVLVLAVPLTMIYFGREATQRAQRQWRRLSSLAGRFLQLVEGLPTLRAFGREAQGRREVEAATDGVRSATMRTLRVAFLSALSMDMIAGFGVGFVAMVLGLRLLWGQLGLQTAMAVLLVAPEIFIPLRRAGAEFHASTEGQAAADRVLEVLGTGGGGTPTPASAPSGPGVHRVTVPPVPATLAVDGLGVEYEHRDLPALASFSMRVPSGARVALTGPSGSGKSTVFAALLGFVEPSAGTMSFGERLGGDDLAQWRGLFTWLPQRPHLFNTIAGGEPSPRRSGGDRRRTPRRARSRWGCMTSWPACPPGWRPRSATTGSHSAPGSASGSRWHVPCCDPHRWCCSTSPPRRSTRRPWSGSLRRSSRGWVTAPSWWRRTSQSSCRASMRSSRSAPRTP